MTKDEIKLVMQWCLPLDTTSKKLDGLVETFANEHKQAINYSHCCTQLLCIDRWCYNDLTKDNKYKMITQDDEYYTIVNDFGEICKKDKDLFEIIKQ